MLLKHKKTLRWFVADFITVWQKRLHGSTAKVG